MSNIKSKAAVALLVFGTLASQMTSFAFADGKEKETDVTPPVVEVTSQVDENNYNGTNDVEVIPEVFGTRTDEGFMVDVDLPAAGKIKLNVGEECKVVEKVTVKSKEAIKGRVKVTNFDNDVTGVGLDNALGFCKFELIDIDSSKIEEYTWRLKANRAQMVEKEFDENGMTFVIFENNEYKQIDTKSVGGDADNFSYDATTSNLGDQGVVGMQYVAASKLFTMRNILICLGGIFVIALLAILGYAVSNKKEEKV